MKRVLCLVLAAVFALSLTVCGSAVTASAQVVTTSRSGAEPEYFVFAVDGCTAVRGMEFTVAVRTENNPGIVSLKIALQYDAEVLELLSAAEQDFVGVSYGPTDKVPFVINWVDAIHPDNTTDGVITYLTFRVKEDAPIGNTELQITYDPEDVYNAAWDGVPVARQGAYVNVTEYLVGDVNSDLKINNRDLGALLQHVNGWDVAIHTDASDVNGDGKLNNRDLGLLQQYVNGWDVELVQPEPPVATDELLDRVPDSLSGQKIKMMIWWNVTDTDREKAAYFKEETGVEVSYQAVAMHDYLTSLAAKVMANNAPQIAAVINEWYPQPITRGLMQPIENTGWDYSNSTDDIYALSLMEQFSYKGKQYGIALKGSLNPTYEVMFYNKDLLAANGVTETPYDLWWSGKWNWETCLEIARICTNVKQEKYGLANISQYYWMLSAGQDFVLSDVDGLKNNIRSAALLETWIHAWDMLYTYQVIPTSFSNQLQMFYDGQVAMLGGGSYLMGADGATYVPQNADFEWGVVPFPSPKGRTPVAACEGTVWGFPTKVSGNKLQAAMWYLRYYLDDARYTDRDHLGSEMCWEVIEWMSKQQIRSYNSVGVVSYGGKYNAWSIQYSVIDEATTKVQVQTNLQSWDAEIDNHIAAIQDER